MVKRKAWWLQWQGLGWWSNPAYSARWWMANYLCHQSSVAVDPSAKLKRAPPPSTKSTPAANEDEDSDAEGNRLALEKTLSSAQAAYDSCISRSSSEETCLRHQAAAVPCQVQSCFSSTMCLSQNGFFFFFSSILCQHRWLVCILQRNSSYCADVSRDIFGNLIREALHAAAVPAVWH